MPDLIGSIDKIAKALENGDSGGGSFAPDITNPQDGDTLVYNAAQQKWVNGVAGAGGVLIVTFTEDGYDEQQQKPICTADVSYEDVYQAASNGKLVVFIDHVYYNGAAIAVLDIKDISAYAISMGKGEGNVFVQASAISYSYFGIIIEELICGTD